MHTASLPVPTTLHHFTLASQTFSFPVWKRMLALSQEPRVDDISAYASLCVYMFWISRPDNWCKQPQPNHCCGPSPSSCITNETRKIYLPCSHYITWMVMAMHDSTHLQITWSTELLALSLKNRPISSFHPGHSMFCGTCSWIADKFSPTHWNWIDFFKSYGFYLNYSI